MEVRRLCRGHEFLQSGFIEVGQRLGTDAFTGIFSSSVCSKRLGSIFRGEAGTIMHQKKDIGPVELATISFGQSFQITPIRLAATVCSLINGGHKITPHFGVEVREDDGTLLETLSYKEGKQIVSEQVSKTMRMILEKSFPKEAAKGLYRRISYREERQRLPRHCREVQINTFPLFLDLFRQKIPGSLESVL